RACRGNARGWKGGTARPARGRSNRRSRSRWRARRNPRWVPTRRVGPGPAAGSRPRRPPTVGGAERTDTRRASARPAGAAGPRARPARPKRRARRPRTPWPMLRRPPPDSRCRSLARGLPRASNGSGMRRRCDLCWNGESEVHESPLPEVVVVHLLVADDHPPALILSGMVADARALMTLMRGIVAGDTAEVARSLAASPAFASSSLRLHGGTRQSEQDFFSEEIAHYLYGGDTPLHAAAAAHRPAIVSELVSMGADVRARNR